MLLKLIYKSTNILRVLLNTLTFTHVHRISNKKSNGLYPFSEVVGLTQKPWHIFLFSNISNFFFN